MQNFAELKLAPGTQDAIASMGYETPSPVQALAIPPLLEGKDVLAQARTGTGKTAAFGIPIVDGLRASTVAGVGALVLVPTRELALQVTEELARIAKGSRLKVISIYGGVGFGKQVDDLRSGGTQIVVATPGRLIDLLQQGVARLERVRILILDEADRMLDMGFLPDVERILRAVPAQRQTALFSATVPDPIRRIVTRFLRTPVNVQVEPGPTATPLCEQFKVAVAKENKTAALLAFLAQEKPERAIIFTRTKHLARRLAASLDGAGWRSVPLQGNMSQGQRERAMDAFRRGEARLLVATDVAGRGIDVPEVSHVFNYDLPDEPEAYVHRIGRTGRMGRAGRAITFVQPDQQRDLRDVERVAGSAMRGMPIPAEAGEGPDHARPKVEFRAMAPERRHPPRPAQAQGRSAPRAQAPRAHSQGRGRSHGGQRWGRR
ncbi:MAG: DEAD/DEAH box helicase [Thermoplasmatota archaeon]